MIDRANLHYSRLVAIPIRLHKNVSRVRRLLNRDVIAKLPKPRDTRSSHARHRARLRMMQTAIATRKPAG